MQTGLFRLLVQRVLAAVLPVSPLVQPGHLRQVKRRGLCACLAAGMQLLIEGLGASCPTVRTPGVCSRHAACERRDGMCSLWAAAMIHHMGAWLLPSCQDQVWHEYVTPYYLGAERIPAALESTQALRVQQCQ
jgi:hypothetical protein